MEQNLKINQLIGGKATDDRGSVSFVNDFNFANVKRFYQVENHRNNFIRAWHGHKKEGKYIYVAKGVALVGAVSMEDENVKKFILSENSPQILWVPPGYYNGFMNLKTDTVVQFFSTSTIEESLEDDIRMEYDKWDIWNIKYR